MKIGMKNFTRHRARVKKALRELIFTLIGGHRQRWKTIRQLAADQAGLIKKRGN